MSTETIQIPLSQGQVALVDPEDADLLNIRWYAHKGPAAKNYYALHGSGTIGTARYMHRVILERKLGRPLEKGEVVDHIDTNGLNNTRANLRPATRRTNQYNQGLNRANKSGYKGVFYFKRDRKWRAQIKYCRKIIYLGNYDTPEEAAAAYREAAIKYHGEYARFA